MIWRVEYIHMNCILQGGRHLVLNETTNFPRAWKIGFLFHYLPDSERIVIALFYISQSSLEQVGAVLALPVTTAKNRLRSAKKHLKERILEMAEKTLTDARL